MVDKNRTHITAVLDRSGSMNSLATDTMGGFNQYVKSQRELPGHMTLTLVTFSSDYTVVYDTMDIKDVPELTSRAYRPFGNTALYDAMGKAIIDTGRALSAMPEDQRPGTVIVVVMTDGFENSSTDFAGEQGRQRIQAMVKEQTEVYNWTFVFMGANIDAKAVGSSLGVSAATSVGYVASSEGTRGVFEAVSKGTSRRREYAATEGLKVCADFVDDPNAIIGATKIQGTP